MTRETPDPGPEPPPVHDIDIQWGLAKRGEFPEDSIMVGWIEAALGRAGLEDVSVSVRVMDRDEIAHLSDSFRGNPAPTNVLSFPAEGEDESGRRLLGDIAICADIVAEEAAQQHKSVAAHMAHMVVHGVLHLAGHDHMEVDEAAEMEAIEVELLDRFGFPNPYFAGAPQEGA